MTRLTRKQLDFLRHHDIPFARVYDATGMQRRDYQQVMRDLDLWVAYGVTPCGAGGHALRTRAGHCVQCKNAENLIYLRRFDEAGEVYVAKSMRSLLVKVGLSKNASERIGQLNNYQYAGHSDWTYVWHVEAAKAGRVESQAHNSLVRFAKLSTSLHGGHPTECRELFSCTPRIARTAVEDALRAIRD